MKIYKRIQTIVYGALLVLLFLYIIFLMAAATTMDLPTPDGYQDWLLTILIILTACSAVLQFIRAKIEGDRTKLFSLIAAFFFTGLFWLIYLKNTNDFIAFLALCLLAFAESDNRKIIIAYLIAAGSVVFFAICSSLGGFISDYVYMKDFHIRSSLGILYSTDLASIVLYLLLGVWIVFGDRLTDLFTAFLAFLSALFSYFVAYSTTGLVCSLVLCAFCILHRLIGRWEISGKTKKVIVAAVLLVYPMIGSLMFLLIFLFHHGLNLVDVFPSLTVRLRLAESAFETYGITLFGSKMTQIGAGGSTYVDNSAYNFVDSSYPLMLLRYGLIFFLAVSALWEISLWKALKKGDRRIALCMIIIALHSFSEHHFSELNYNILLIVSFTQFQQEKVFGMKEDLARVGKTAVRHLPSLCLLIFILLLSPVLASWSRVIGRDLGLTGGGEVQYLVCLLILLCFGLILGWMYSLDRLWNDIRDHKSAIRPLIFTGLFTVIALAGLYGCSEKVDRIAADASDRLASEESAITLILNHAEYPVYADTDAAIYQRLYGGFHYSLWNAEELSRYRYSTVILDINNDSTLFVDRGFLYTQISDQHAVYTTDADVISALQDAGYHLTAYNASVHEENLAALAERNDLDLDASGICLQGKEASLTKGNDTNLRAGRYTITFSLRLDSFEGAADATVCTLMVNKHGDETLVTRPVSRNEFDEQGRADIEVVIEDSSNAFRDTEFLVTAEDGVVMHVSGISWQMTPYYDVHKTYDNNWNCLEEIYYDLDGNSLVMDQGYSIQKHEYNRKNQLIETTYCDKDGNPVIISTGYAVIRWERDRDDNVTRESYYDVSGNPVALSSGQASDSRSYDNDGNLTDQKFYDVDGNPVRISAGYAEIRKEYDDQNRCIREEYYDENGDLMLLNGEYAILVRTYDSNGNVLSESYYDTSDKPILRSAGYAEICWTYNENNQRITESYFDTSGNSVALPSGQASDSRSYDDRGNLADQKFYDVDGNPVRISAGYAEIRREYDDQNRCIREEYYDEDGNLMLLNGEYAILTRTYDSIGNVLSESYYDTSGKPILRSAGYAEIRWTYNENNQRITESYFDTSGNLVALSSGQASEARTYDAAGNVIDRKYYDAAGNPVMITDGYAEVSYEYDSANQVISETHYDTEGNVINES